MQINIINEEVKEFLLLAKSPQIKEGQSQGGRESPAFFDLTLRIHHWANLPPLDGFEIIGGMLLKSKYMIIVQACDLTG